VTCRYVCSMIIATGLLGLAGVAAGANKGAGSDEPTKNDSAKGEQAKGEG